MNQSICWNLYVFEKFAISVPDGAIRVGVEGQNVSFIEWVDPEPLKIKFISFSTWSGIEAKWYFNCNRTQSEEVI